MRFNENIAISTSKVLLVPYDAHHVPRYHEWMEDPAIREATASERLSLAEEYENQTSWREASDKLTFILCEPLGAEHDVGAVAGVVDAPVRMVGDVNLFLTPWDGGDEGEGEGEGEGGGGDDDDGKHKMYCTAEVDIMIADPKHRGRGLGRAAVATFLLFVRRHLDAILAEYVGADAGSSGGMPELRDVVAKINAGNTGSIALFKSLGFAQKGDVNYFGEVRMVLPEFREEAAWAAGAMSAGYEELVYDRSQLEQTST